MNMKAILIFLGAVLLAGCFAAKKDPGQGWHTISQEEAKKMMEQDNGRIILDVREYEEYYEGFIPDAVCMPADRIGDLAPALLPDKDRVILVYCRSGNRSRQAAEKLAAMGYTNVYDFGGIRDWTGPVAREEVIQPMPIYCLRVGDHWFTFTPAENETAEAFLEQLSRGSLETSLTALDGTVKTGPFSWPLPGEAQETEYTAGDILTDLKGSILICTDSGSGPYVRLAETDGMYLDELREALAGEPAETAFFIEWTE